MVELPVQFGRYQVAEHIGSGQMGTVYRAIDPLIERPVAVKVLRDRPEVGGDDGDAWRARFEREVRVSGRLSHANVVGVLDVGLEGNDAFIVMEYVDGTDLEALLERERTLAVDCPSRRPGTGAFHSLSESPACCGAPAFVSLAGASFGLQVGAQSSDVVLLFSTAEVLQQLSDGELTLGGGGATVAAGPLGDGPAVDADRQSEVYSYTRSKGLFAGLSLEGVTLRADERANAIAYGRGAGPAQILRQRGDALSPDLAEFVRALAGAVS
jgi:hypothetical protein